MAEFAQTTINKINQFYSRWAPRVPSEVTPRNVLIFCVIALLCLGSIMVAVCMECLMLNAFMRIHFTMSFVTGFQLRWLAFWPMRYTQFRSNVWFNNTFPLWILTILLLAAVLVVGTEVNGSTRWIRVAGFTLQASEVAKVMMAIFTARLCGTPCRRSKK